LAIGEQRADLADRWPAAMAHGDQIAFPVVVMRGGTSRGAFLHLGDLPIDPEVRDRVILALYGSPDARQIDGLGGADPLTSKVAIVSRSERPDCDVEYLFGQVAIDRPLVDYGGNCGNMLAGVGPFAVDEGLVEAVEPATHVRIHNVNTDRVIVAEVPASDGRACTAGDTAVAGVPGTGAAIVLDFSATVGTLGRGLFPTGETRELLGGVEVTIADVANPTVFAAAARVGLDRDSLRAPLDETAVRRMRELRALGAERLGLASSAAHADEESLGIPKVYALAPAGDDEDCDLVGRGLAFGRPHAAYATTVAVCTAAASRVPGTVVADQLGADSRAAPELRIGHASGVLAVLVAVEETPEGWYVRRAAIERTARRLSSGLGYVPRTVN
jgi:2-methylaconitate cis-trans-isomerase PrpF